MSDHAHDDEWHVDWQEGICVYKDEHGVWVVDRKIHRHPYGTEYTEILETDT